LFLYNKHGIVFIIYVKRLLYIRRHGKQQVVILTTTPNCCSPWGTTASYIEVIIQGSHNLFVVLTWVTSVIEREEMLPMLMRNTSYGFHELFRIQ